MDATPCRPLPSHGAHCQPMPFSAKPPSHCQASLSLPSRPPMARPCLPFIDKPCLPLSSHTTHCQGMPRIANPCLLLPIPCHLVPSLPLIAKSCLPLPSLSLIVKPSVPLPSHASRDQHTPPIVKPYLP